jgi:hypothetical protein
MQEAGRDTGPGIVDPPAAQSSTVKPPDAGGSGPSTVKPPDAGGSGPSTVKSPDAGGSGSNTVKSPGAGPGIVKSPDAGGAGSVTVNSPATHSGTVNSPGAHSVTVKSPGAHSTVNSPGAGGAGSGAVNSPQTGTPSYDHLFNLDVLIIGNSHTSMIQTKKMYRNQTMVVHTLNDKSIRGAYDYIKTCPHRPKVVVLLVADNCVVNTSVESCVENTRHLVTRCKQTFTGATVCLSHALPRRMNMRAQSMSHAAKASLYNSAIADMEVVAVSHDTLRIEESGAFLRDGVHLTPMGLATIVRNIKSVLNPLLGLKPYDQYQTPDSDYQHRHRNNTLGSQPNGNSQAPPLYRRSDDDGRQSDVDEHRRSYSNGCRRSDDNGHRRSNDGGSRRSGDYGSQRSDSGVCRRPDDGEYRRPDGSRRPRSEIESFLDNLGSLINTYRH